MTQDQDLLLNKHLTIDYLRNAILSEKAKAYQNFQNAIKHIMKTRKHLSVNTGEENNEHEDESDSDNQRKIKDNFNRKSPMRKKHKEQILDCQYTLNQTLLEIKSDYENIIKNQYSNAYWRANTTYNQKVSAAHSLYQTQNNAARNTTYQLIQSEAEKITPEAWRESFQIIAEATGLNGISSDIHTYLATDTIHAEIQPLLTFDDLFNELHKEAKYSNSSILIDIFYDVPPENQELKKIVLSFFTQSQEIFVKQIELIPELKKHLINTIIKANHHLIQSNSLDALYLCKTHVMNARTHFSKCWAYETTPIFKILNKKMEVTAIASKQYYQAEKQFKEEREQAIKTALVEKEESQSIAYTLMHKKLNILEAADLENKNQDKFVVNVKKITFFENRNERPSNPEDPLNDNSDENTFNPEDILNHLYK